MPRYPKPYVASCETCRASKTFDGAFANPREYLEGKGWYAGARSRGPMAWYCPLHVPRGNPDSPGHSNPCAPCRWVLDLASPLPEARYPAICAGCGVRGERRVSGDDVLDDYGLTVARFAGRPM